MLRYSLLTRLVVAYLLPTITCLFLFGMFAHRITKQRLEISLGRELVSIAAVSASQLRPASIEFLEPGDEQTKTARRLHLKLTQIKNHLGLRRVFVIDGQHLLRVDTNSNTRIGDRHYHATADRVELERVFAGDGASSVLFRGEDGLPYKTGYSPIMGAAGKKTIAAVGVEQSAGFYRDLDRLRRMLLFAGGLITFIVAAVSVVLARRITRPLRRLAGEAQRIGTGQLHTPIAVETQDEVGLLASTMNEMRKRISEREQELQLMISGIAHEVRNPLGGMALFTGLLRESLQSDAIPADTQCDALKQLQRIERELDSLNHTVSDFLAFSRRTPPQRQPTDVSELLSDVCELLQGEAENANVEILLHPAAAIQSEAVPLVDLDAEQIRRVMLNLIGNAIAASKQQSQIEVQATYARTELTLSVKDYGSGIEASEKDDIFRPFFTTKEKGTGLGLALCKKIVEAHGGSIRAVSNRGEDGVTFFVTLALLEKSL